MMSPIATFLTEFRPLFGDLDEPQAVATPKPSEPPRISEACLVQRMEEAREAGASEAKTQARLTLDAKVAALEAEHGRRLLADRQHWVESEGAALRQTLETSLVAMEERIAHTVADVLGPLVPKVVAIKAVAALRDAITTLLSDDRKPLLRVTGPVDLVDAVAAACRDKPGIVFEPDDTPEVTIRSGSTAIETSLTLWAATLRAALGTQS